MDSVGERLYNAREERQLSLEQVARDTHIAKSFIEALEKENFEVFPGESYLIGFLRKYSIYLELDADEMLSLFRNTQLQEQPSPVDELLDKKQPKRRNIALVIVMLIIVASGIAVISVINSSAPQQIIQAPVFQKLVFSSGILEQEFEAWTSIEVNVNDTVRTIELREITSPLSLYFDNTIIRLESDDVEFVDFDADSRPDLRVVYKTTLSNGNPVLRLDRITAGFFAEDSARIGENEGDINFGATTEPSREISIQQISTLFTQDTFFVEATFRGPVLFRYLSEEGERAQQFYDNGDSFQIEVNNYLYIWVSNAGKLEFTINGQDVRLGKDGSMAAYSIARRDRRLELIPLY